MPDPEALFAALQSLGAAERAHLNGTLAAHLRDTAALLRAWGAPEPVCTAGLYHAVYGTDAFRTALTSPSMRQNIRELIGPQAEELVYLYCACQRDSFYPRIGTPTQLQFPDRFTDTDYTITRGQLACLCELILANELEIASGSATFRAEHGESLCELFNRMAGLASDTALRAYRSILVA